MPSSRKKPKIAKPKKSKKKKFDTRPKNPGVVNEHVRGGISVRQYVRLVGGGDNKLRPFKVTTKEEADNAEMFNWKDFDKIEHLNPIVVEMYPAAFLLLTAEYSDPEFEMSQPELFDERNKKRDDAVNKYAKLFEKMKRTPFVILTVDTKTGQVWRYSPNSRYRVQALKELGFGNIPVVLVEEE